MIFELHPDEVIYNDDNQYRRIMRKIFNMKDLENQEYDEINYDPKNIEKYLNDIFSKTEDEPEFLELYELASALLISTDISIGITLLFSFDYLKDFYTVVYLFVNDNIQWKNKISNLINKLKI
jgi:hypothetical protein